MFSAAVLLLAALSATYQSFPPPVRVYGNLAPIEAELKHERPDTVAQGARSHAREGENHGRQRSHDGDSRRRVEEGHC